MLEEGKAILLFDGLDEVRHEGKKRDRLTTQLQDFVRKYDRCQHLITCRIAASEYIFQGFKTVEVADFTPEQIVIYAAKWFGDDVATFSVFYARIEENRSRKACMNCATHPLFALTGMSGFCQ